MNRYILEGFLEELLKEGSTYVGGFSPGAGFSGGDENGGMHRFINTRAMQHMAMGGGFKSSGNFEGVAMAPGGGGFMPAFSGGEGGFTADLPGGGMLHNYAPSASMRAAMAKMGEKSLREAFDEKVDDKGKWTGGLNSEGYPKMRDGKKIRLASHVSLELAGRGPAPSNKVVAHKDDNPLNVSASNLEIITQKHNLQDCEDRGRWRPRGPNKPDDAK